MSNTIEEGGHGSSPAAWTAVVIMLIGFTVATAALFLDVIPLVFIGAAIIPIGLIVGGVMKAVGLGVGGHRAVGGSH
ncbi:HGxxPAAW family protein [uncultured Amnibacterium sp.]|uniref:HGxxPAAW family protein n=1 Tax=uncultured Amnibacterium sp. TaxID=1631851 RepID=UPI0035CB9445